MTNWSVGRLGATDLLSAYGSGATSPTEAVAACIERIQDLDGEINAFTVLRIEESRTEAKEAEKQIMEEGPTLPLHGVPVAVKELYDVAGSETAYGSMVLSGRIPERDAVAVSALKQAGAILVGLTRSHEFAWGITTQHETRGSTKNPWSTRRIPGGSSGGSAAAVAAGMVPLALGTDTGGSVRIPAAFCGVAGLKPTFGVIDLTGVCPLAPSLDHAGVLARTIKDCALTATAMSALDGPRWQKDLKGFRAVMSSDLHLVELHDSHRRVFELALDALSSLGAELEERDFNYASEIKPTFATIQRFEAYRVHTVSLGTYPQRASEYSSSVQSNLAFAAEVDQDAYAKAMLERVRLNECFDHLMDRADLLITPVSPGPPSTLERPDVATLNGEEIPLRDMVMPFTMLQNLLGLPAATIFAGTDDLGLPIGLQITSSAGRDDAVLIAAQLLEETLGTQWPADHHQ